MTAPELWGRLMSQTITLYHPDFDGDFSCRRQVVEGVAYQWQHGRSIDNLGKSYANRSLMGETAETKALLILPPEVEVALGDKVIEGVGPEITERGQWAALLPENTPSLTVVRSIQPRYWGGTLVFREVTG